MTALGRRLTALEQIAERSQQRDREEFTRAEVARRYAAEGMKLTPAEVESKTARALALGEHMVLLAASGLSLPQIARQVAIEHDLPPERVVALFAELRSKYDR